MASAGLSNRGRLLVTCPDRPGLIATLSELLFRHGANIVNLDQYAENPGQGMFFMRLEFDLPPDADGLAVVEPELSEVAQRFQMQWRLTPASQRKRLAVFVSREDHCLKELLWQCQTGEIPADIAVVISNHPVAEATARQFEVPFFYVPVTPQNKEEAEARQLQIVEESKADVVVLARYMQILSPKMLAPWQNRIINIHHSFLPAFVGANPYRQAFERGVKLIGATAHYVTADLDQGPIIEQDVHRVDHRYHVEDLRRLGRHLERMVLARAVRWHAEDRILVHQNRTVVFP
ncbi:MAG: formyltetrahydrofolate deformylase [Firmicutes bacterium]|nr:formyltetrahydrofolate deformylase [Alicyclobacillaceae bacterium]MCL6497189.1 formyltetrahydrofolate deformylase [Bacillota bacterium]